MTESQQLEPRLRGLRVVLEKLELYEALATTKRAELDEHCAKYWPSLSSSEEEKYDTSSENNPQMVAKLFVLGEEWNMYKLDLQMLIGQIKSDEVTALFTAEGLSQEEAALKARKYLVSLSEKWVGLRENALGSEHTLSIVGKRLCEGIHGSQPQTEEFTRIEQLEGRYHIICSELHEAICDTYEGIKNFYPHCESEKSQEYCEKMILRDYCDVLKGYHKLHELLSSVPGDALCDMLKPTGLSYSSARELVHMKWQEMDADEEYFQKEVDDLKDLIKPFLQKYEHLLGELPAVEALSLSEQVEPKEQTSHPDISETKDE